MKSQTAWSILAGPSTVTASAFVTLNVLVTESLVQASLALKVKVISAPAQKSTLAGGAVSNPPFPLQPALVILNLATQASYANVNPAWSVKSQTAWSILAGPSTVTASPLVMLNEAVQEPCLAQSSVTLKLTVTLPPVHKFGAVKFVNPEGLNVPFPPVAVNPATQVLNAVFNASWLE